MSGVIVVNFDFRELWGCVLEKWKFLPRILGLERFEPFFSNSSG